MKVLLGAVGIVAKADTDYVGLHWSSGHKPPLTPINRTMSARRVWTFLVAERNGFRSARFAHWIHANFNCLGIAHIVLYLVAYGAHEAGWAMRTTEVVMVAAVYSALLMKTATLRTGPFTPWNEMAPNANRRVVLR